MYAKVTSLGVTGLAGYIVQVEADLSGGLPQFNLVGLPDSAGGGQLALRGHDAHKHRQIVHRPGLAHVGVLQ